VSGPAKQFTPIQRGVMRINNLPGLKTFRKELRKNLTPAEASLWNFLKEKKLEGRKFRRQHSIGKYILDFYCPSENLAIELDGQVHYNEFSQEYDEKRDNILKRFGIRVLRYENIVVFRNLEWLLDDIKSNFGWSEK
jgi:very-short-patch-repair endonuclease